MESIQLHFPAPFIFQNTWKAAFHSELSSINPASTLYNHLDELLLSPFDNDAVTYKAIL